MTTTMIARAARLLAVAGLAVSAACSSDGPTGGPVSGAVDQHCVMNDEQIKTEVGMCITLGGVPDGGATSEPDGGATTDAGVEDDAGTGDPGGLDFGATQNNAEGDDDDCKYRVKWTSSPVRLNADVTFDVSLKRLFDGMGATGADVSIEAFLDDTHPTPSTTITSTETAGGNYKVGKVRFDKAGTWTVRFHYYETCSDAPEDSPHGHIAFFVKVP